LQPNDEEPGFGFDSNNDDMAVYNVFPLHYEEALPPQLPAITQHDVGLLQHLDYFTLNAIICASFTILSITLPKKLILNWISGYH
jgi:hypothetical protein